jgi:hypothetical protein
MSGRMYVNQPAVLFITMPTPNNSVFWVYCSCFQFFDFRTTCFLFFYRYVYSPLSSFSPIFGFLLLRFWFFSFLKLSHNFSYSPVPSSFQDFSNYRSWLICSCLRFICWQPRFLFYFSCYFLCSLSWESSFPLSVSLCSETLSSYFLFHYCFVLDLLLFNFRIICI